MTEFNHSKKLTGIAPSRSAYPKDHEHERFQYPQSTVQAQFAAGLALAVPAASIAPAAFAELNTGPAGAFCVG